MAAISSKSLTFKTIQFHEKVQALIYMASEKHYQGDAALYAALSQFLIRGYNPAKPLYDEADSDDFWIRNDFGEKKIFRCQARSSGFGGKGCEKIGKKEMWVLRPKPKGDEANGTIQFPQSVLEDGVDLVVMCIFHIDRFFIGLFDADDINKLRNKGSGGKTNRKEGKQRPTISFRWSIKISENGAKVFLNKEDVSSHFDQRGGKWDELFPSKYDFSESLWNLTNDNGSTLGVLRLKESGSIESSEFPSAKWRLAPGETKKKISKRLALRLDHDSKKEIEFIYKSPLDIKLTCIDRFHFLVKI